MSALDELELLLRQALGHPDPDENVTELLELLAPLADSIVTEHYGRTAA